MSPSTKRASSDRQAGRALTPSGGSLPRRPAAVRSDDITDQLERRWARWHDAGVGLPPPQTLPFTPFSAGGSRPYACGRQRSEGRGDSMLGKSRAETGGGPAERSKDRGLGAFVRRHGLVSYYAMAYGMSWLFWLPYVLSQHGLGVLDIPFPEVLGTTQLAGILLGAYLGPLGAAFVVTAISEGRPGLRRWGDDCSGGTSAGGGTCSPWWASRRSSWPAPWWCRPGRPPVYVSPPWVRCSPTCRSSCCRCSPPVWRRSRAGVTSPWCATSGYTVPSWAP